MASPRQRAARWRYAQYAVLVAVVLVTAFVADWGQLQRAFWNWELVKEQFPRVLTIALKNTLIYTACGFAFGLVARPGPGADAPLERGPLPVDRDAGSSSSSAGFPPWSSSSR